MESSFNEALKVATEKYPHKINYYEEYKDYYVFGYDDGIEHTGGTKSPIVIRKADMVALNYSPAIFFHLDASAEDVGDILSKGEI
ncbi:MAG: hypothetical protein IKE43_10600 [Coriobacteriales bacterium]|nr:hypothetical protein [Coriobacteriales bacterium]